MSMEKGCLFKVSGIWTHKDTSYRFFIMMQYLFVSTHFRASSKVLPGAFRTLEVILLMEYVCWGSIGDVKIGVRELRLHISHVTVMYTFEPFRATCDK